MTDFSNNARIFTHGLRGTLTKLDDRFRCSVLAISKQTGHKCLEIIRSYQNLRGVTGIIQQMALLPS